MEKQYWIVGIGGNELDGVGFHKVFGTKEEIKAHIAALVQSDRDNPDLEFEYGTEEPTEIEERSCNDSLYGYSCFYDSHIDYEAMPLNSIQELA